MQGSHPEPAQPRIIKKKKSSEAGHGGAWKVAYADFVTAMMALFIVLWIMGQSQAIRNNVAQYFKNPGLLPGASGVLETSDMGGVIPTPGHSQELQTPSPVRPEVASDKGSLEEVKKRISEVIAQMPELGRLQEQVHLEITDEGLRIELLDRENFHFFDVGSTTLKSETKGLLGLIAQELGKVPNRLTIEGHTDSRPYGSQNYTNWELSADRANTARRVLEASGLKQSQVMAVRGCADQQLRHRQDPMDPQNRRVSIIVNFLDKGKSGSKGATNVLDALEKAQKKAGTANSPVKPPAPMEAPSGDVKSGTPSPPREQPAILKESSQTPEVPARGQPAAAPDALNGQSGTVPAPSSGEVLKGASPRPPPELEEQVRDEVQQLFNHPAQPTGAGQVSAREAAGPRPRLGW